MSTACYKDEAMNSLMESSLS